MNTIISKQVLPTYIKAFLRQDMECVLVYKKKSSEKFQEEWSFSSELKQFPNINDVTADSALDLTGNPLHVDLDESLKFTAANISLADCSPNWTIAEAQHFPLLLNEARNVLNTKFNSTSLSEPVFCITDGSDAQNTILIGKHHSKDFIITYLGQIMDLQPLKNDELWLEQLRKEHDMFTVIKPDSVQYNFHRIYNIYGSIVQDTPALEYSKCNGCVLLETSWNTYTNQEPNISETTMKIILKVISGHKDSIIHSLWNQLGDLQKYLGIIANQEAANDGNTVMANNSIPDINNEIYKLCYNRINKKWALKSKGLEFTRLREENIIDKLWSLLNRCQNLKDLRHSLSNFLRLSKIENFDENDVLLADLVQYCSVNKEYISNLTYSESLKILVNFGFEKLKQDYLTIINFYDPIFQDALVKNWRSNSYR
ncbi:hypothetical protein HHI36_008196 [Cryptolaemus montrouzieri]|uniref:Protein zwilch n=1 Tax=Cryptolaemus montrouzieri TaxID=559131 RepID=A0ABD2MRU2_9CUCU